MKLSFSLLATSLSLTLATPLPSAPSSLAPPSFKITNVVHGGSGCPQGSMNITWTDTRVLPICTSPSTARVVPS
jgi:hypothetical protein